MIITRTSRRGLSLIEVLVAIGIVAIIIAIVLPATELARESARHKECQNKIRQLGMAMLNYHSQFTLFPPGGVHTTKKPPGTIPRGDQLTEGRAPWTVLILPHLDEVNRYNAFSFNDTFSCLRDKTSATPEPNLTQQYLRVTKYSCPDGPNSESSGLYSNYAACQGGGLPSDAAAVTTGTYPRLFYNNGMFYHNSSVRSGDITDGTSNTVMIGETKYVGTPASFAPKEAWWPWSASVRGDPTDTPSAASLFNISATVDPINFPQNGQYTEAEIVKHGGVFEGCGHGGQQRVYGSWHEGGTNFVLADGSVRFLSENMDLKTYRSLGQKANGLPTEF